jgi:phospholipase A1
MHHEPPFTCPRGLLLLAWLLLPSMALADVGASLDDCLLERMRTAGDDVTVGSLRRGCRERLASQPAEEGAASMPAVSRRLSAEQETMGRPFVITPHRPNYFLFAYNFSDPNTAPFVGQFPGLGDDVFKAVETKFQISLKFPIVENLLGSGGDLFFAYTNRSFWQQFQTDDEVSSPFRETNHEPEAWLSFANDWKFLGFTNRLNAVGLSHQSNGRAGELSRSWNRLYASMVLERGDLALAFKPWWRLPEDAETDDNPDIEDYLGNFELLGVYKAGHHTFTAMGRHNLDFDTPRGALRLDWSFPLHGQLRGYLQLFNGYGESLIDYDHNVTSLGLGVQLTDWL